MTNKPLEVPYGKIGDITFSCKAETVKIAGTDTLLRVICSSADRGDSDDDDTVSRGVVRTVLNSRGLEIPGMYRAEARIYERFDPESSSAEVYSPPMALIRALMRSSVLRLTRRMWLSTLSSMPRSRKAISSWSSNASSQTQCGTRSW